MYLNILRQRAFPLSFADDSNTNDVVKAMQGRMSGLIYLKPHEYLHPRLTFNLTEIYKEQAEESISSHSQDEVDSKPIVFIKDPIVKPKSPGLTSFFQVRPDR